MNKRVVKFLEHKVRS